MTKRFSCEGRGNDGRRYSYTVSEWKDFLTNYNGQTITYDAVGNPLNYRDGISLTWQNGRVLASYSDSSNNFTMVTMNIFTYMAITHHV